MTLLGDRRRTTRLDVAGLLWGVLMGDRQVRILNVSGGGALVAALVPAPVDSAQRIELTISGRPVSVEARVRHLGQVPGGRGLHAIGLELLDAPPGFVHALT